MDIEKKLIFLVGSTAVGKTSISILLARKIDAEIISCDSMQAYKYMDILTQKPTKKEYGSIVHHLVGFLEPSQLYSAALFREKALVLIDEILKRDKMPLFVGGSGLYVKALVDGLFSMKEPPDFNLRARLYKEALLAGSQSLYNRLKDIDSVTAAKLHPNDTRRIIRAIEVYEKTNMPMSILKENKEGIWGKYDIKIFAITRPRPLLYKRIDDRAEKMFDEGLVDEVKSLLDKNLSYTAASALGIKEVKGYLDNDYSLNEAKRLLKRNTRHFAKRQLTWFRADKRINWIEVDAIKTDKEIVELIISKI